MPERAGMARAASSCNAFAIATFSSLICSQKSPDGNGGKHRAFAACYLCLLSFFFTIVLIVSGQSTVQFIRVLCFSVFLCCVLCSFIFCFVLLWALLPELKWMMMMIMMMYLRQCHVNPAAKLQYSQQTIQRIKTVRKLTGWQRLHLAVVRRRQTLVDLLQHPLTMVLVFERRAERKTAEHHRIHDDSATTHARRQSA